MNKIQCVLSIKEFSVTEYGKQVNYIAIFPTDIPENEVDDAIKHKFESIGEINYKQIIIVLKEQYDAVLKPQIDILSKFNQSMEEFNIPIFKDACRNYIDELVFIGEKNE